MAKKILYFAYGVNVDCEGMAIRCPSAKPLGKATLKGYILRFRGGLANAERVLGDSQKAAVIGVLWRISKGNLQALDKFEGYPELYGRREVEVITDGGATVRATMYYMKQFYKMSPPSDWVSSAICRGYNDFGIDIGQFQHAVREAEIVSSWEGNKLKHSISIKKKGGLPTNGNKSRS